MATTAMIDYWDELQAVTAVQAILNGTGKPVGYGDSIFYYLWNCWAIGNTCAFPGATAQDLLNNGSAWNNAVFRDVAPSCGFLMIGTNDVLADEATGVAFNSAMGSAFLDTLGGLIPAIRQFLPNPGRLALCTILPMEQGKSYDAVALNPYVLGLNGVIAQAAVNEGLPLLDTHAAFAGTDGYALPGSTYDGIHPYLAAVGGVKTLITNQITAWNA